MLVLGWLRRRLQIWFGDIFLIRRSGGWRYCVGMFGHPVDEFGVEVDQSVVFMLLLANVIRESPKQLVRRCSRCNRRRECGNDGLQLKLFLSVVVVLRSEFSRFGERGKHSKTNSLLLQFRILLSSVEKIQEFAILIINSSSSVVEWPYGSVDRTPISMSK